MAEFEAEEGVIGITPNGQAHWVRRYRDEKEEDRRKRIEGPPEECQPGE